MVLGGIVVAVVDADDDGDVLALAWGSDDDFLGSSLHVLAGPIAIAEDTCRFDADIDAQVGPG